MSDYNGWTNWATWNTNNWLSSDEGAWREARRICGRYDLDRAENQLIVLANETIPLLEGINYDDVNWEEIYNAVNE